MPNPIISFVIIKFTDSSSKDKLGKSGISMRLKHVCALRKFLELLLYSVFVIQNLEIFPRFDSRQLR